MRRWPEIVFAAAVTGCLCAAIWFVSDETVSKDEKRRLEERPPLPRTLSDAAGFGNRFERWLGDHFPLRAVMVRLRNLMRMRGSALVLEGSDGWLFGAIYGAPETFMNANRFTAPELESVRGRVRAFGAAAKAAGVKKVYFTFSNDKESIYGEHYPKGYRKVHPESRLDQVWAAVQGVTPDVTFVRFTDRLMEAKKEHDIFCRSGTHMTGYASYLVYGWLAETIRADFPSFAQVRDGDCVFGRDTKHTDMDILIGGAVPFYPERYLETEFADLRSPRAETRLRERRSNEGASPFVWKTRNESAGNGLRMFLLTDSFGWRWAPFLAESVAKLQVVYIGGDRPFDMGRKCSRELLKLKPNILVVNFTERFLQRLLTLRFPKGGN